MHLLSRYWLREIYIRIESTYLGHLRPLLLAPVYCTLQYVPTSYLIIMHGVIKAPVIKITKELPQWLTEGHPVLV